ncbi:unnamed protein product [Pleuronectes platessa]|uniref:Uncharacterized protein n=1 Tax=Pleuronectes platessa TaxID=8262 RepID=A0A9N7V3P2_PLEPL|nr:unnamed protein product [Pleuronectes platessa]
MWTRLEEPPDRPCLFGGIYDDRKNSSCDSPGENRYVCRQQKKRHEVAQQWSSNLHQGPTIRNRFRFTTSRFLLLSGPKRTDAFLSDIIMMSSYHHPYFICWSFRSWKKRFLMRSCQSEEEEEGEEEEEEEEEEEGEERRRRRRRRRRSRRRRRRRRRRRMRRRMRRGGEEEEQEEEEEERRRMRRGRRRRSRRRRRRRRWRREEEEEEEGEEEQEEEEEEQEEEEEGEERAPSH